MSSRPNAGTPLQPLKRQNSSGRPRSYSTHGTFVQNTSGLRTESIVVEREYTLRGQIHDMLMGNWILNCLLVFVIPAFIARYGGWSEGICFACSFLGLVPLAAMLGDFTEDLAKRTNDVIGALINVTFGNATELIISIMALRAGMFDVIKLSLIGSVLGNMLLVLGCAFVVGGLQRRILSFNADAVNTYSPLLLLSMLSFVIPSGFSSLHDDNKKGDAIILTLSRQVATVMCLTYAAYIFFTLFTHKHMFEEGDVVDEPPPGEEEEEEDDTPQYTFLFAFVALGIAGTLISFLSDFLVDTLRPAAVQWHLSKQFIAIILVPVVGNAAEHATAVTMAYHNKLNIAIGVAVGSSIQIALFVMPCLVVVAWFGDYPLDMNFHAYSTALLFVSVLVTTNVINDGKTNWLEGLMLLAAYTMIALTYLNATMNMV